MKTLLRCVLALAVLVGCAAGDGPPDGTVDGSMDAAVGDGGSDAGGGSDADAGMLERVGLCESCVVHEQCGSLARCIALTDGDFACAAICNPDIPSCPRGFECVIRPASPDFPVCAPIGERCCVDQDADGYGRGVGCEGPDCDDDAMDVNPGVPELCNGGDDDCDGMADEDAADCGAQACRPNGPAYEEAAPGRCAAGMCVSDGATSCGRFSCELGAEAGDRCATTCVVAATDANLLCIEDAHCDLGDCLDDLPNGGACDEDSDCQSDHCDNGFCCNDGACCNLASDCPSVGGLGTTCDDSATCQGSRGEVTCLMNQCATRMGVPDDSACTASVEASSCGFFRSIYCTGAVNQPPPMCPGTCTADADCDAVAHCDTVCVPNVPDGGVCDEPSDCISAHCTNNVCCASGECCRDATDCPASFSSPPVCATPIGCQGTRDAATCNSYVCGTMRGVGDDSACTSSVLANDCGLYPSRFCTGAIVQPPPMCATNCSADSECDANAHCDLMACSPDLPNGDACDEASDCVSGHCQNGFCCATGDCCAIDANCPSGTYGVASVCNSASSCQGQRRNPQCNGANQCQTGGLVDDDSGCLGLQSNACGLYPAVFCTNMTTQPPDQMGLCAMSCTVDTQCDPGAFCSGGVCTPRGMAGDACTATPQCSSGLQCVDGVCCTSSCTGTCVACNVAGSAGTCTNIPNGSDPAGECAGLSCATHYAGFTGDRCFRRADAPDSAVSCGGSGACQTAAAVCPSQGTGSLQIDCDDLCQSPSAGTCSGTLPGACNNVTPSPPTQTCGTGYCRVTSNRCNMGTQVMCMPGAPRGETCNDIDDDCNGVTDDGLAGDAYESNNTCSTSRHLGTVNTSNPGATLTFTPTIYPSSDFDYFSINVNETDSTCHCCDFFCLDEDIGVSVRLDVPVGAGSYELCVVGTDSACPSWTPCVTVLAGSAGTLTRWRDGACGSGDNARFTWRVRGVGAPAFECTPYTLTVSGMGGCE